jgi:single-strand DNA-binding protein
MTAISGHRNPVIHWTQCDRTLSVRPPTIPSQQDGQWRDGDTSFFKVNVWRGQAEHLAESLSKGDRVMVTGRLRQRSWETPEGEKRSVAEIEADEVGASLKWATAKIERSSQRGNGDRSSGRERQAERGGGVDPAWWTSKMRALPSRWESDATPPTVLPPEYKIEVAERTRTTGKTVGQVARELDLTETAVREWVKAQP